jgi:hypothetical protein
MKYFIFSKNRLDSGKVLTGTRDSISWVSRMTGTIERSLGVGTVSIVVTIVRQAFVTLWYTLWETFVNIYQTKYIYNHAVEYSQHNSSTCQQEKYTAKYS